MQILPWAPLRPLRKGKAPPAHLDPLAKALPPKPQANFGVRGKVAVCSALCTCL